MKPHSLTNAVAAIPEFLVGGGEMGQRIREFDWGNTPLGPIDTWPQSLRTCIRIMLTSRQPIWIGWGKELIKFYNDPYQAIVGGKHPWALGKPASVVWKDIWRDIEPMLKQVMEKDQGTYVESQLLIMERNGYPEETYYTFSYTPIPGDDGKTAGMFCANTDDTDKIISERQLRTLTQLGKRLVDSQSAEDVIERTIETIKHNQQDFPFAFFRTLKNGKAILARSTPLGEGEKVIRKEIALGGSDPVAKVIAKAIETGKMQLFDHLLSTVGLLPKGAWQVPTDQALVIPIVNSGQKEPYGILVLGKNPYRLLDENYSGFFSLIADQIATAFSDVFILEEERKRAEALAEIDRAKTTFFSNISHEFRTPLTLLLGPIEDVLNDPETKDEHKLRLDVAYRNTLRMQKLVNTLLDFSRIEAGRIEGRFTKVDICALTKDLASTFRSAIEKAGMSLVYACEGIRSEVYVDTDMWEKIVLNLVSNAFKYSREGTITVTVKESGGQVQLSVSDNGIGIPEDQLEKVFDRFHRIETSRGRSQEGTGIGLAMVKELVKLHQGTIEVKSIFGQGSTFLVSIPTGKDHLNKEHLQDGFPQSHDTVVKNAFVQEALKWTPKSEEAESPYGGNGTGPEEAAVAPKDRPTVLLADDNADMREYVARLLSGAFHVMTATDGEEAYEKILAARPALVLSDVMMPRLDGFGLLKKIRANADVKNTPVIFLSARAGEGAKIEGLEKGADDYLVKPFSVKELLARVTAQIDLAKKRNDALHTVLRLFDEVPFAVTSLRGKDLVIDYINQYTLDLWTCKREDVLHKPLFEARPDIRAGAEPMHAEVYRTGKRFIGHEVAIPFVMNNNITVRYFNVIADPLFDEDGEMVGQLATAIEVTEEVMARRELLQNEERLRALSEQLEIKVKERTAELASLNERLLIQNETFKQAEESSGQGSYSFNLNNGHLLYSDNLYRLLGYEPGAFPPAIEEFNKHVHPDDQEYVLQAAQKVVESGKANDWRYRMIRRNGEVIHIRGTGRVIRSGEDKLLVGTLQNITSDVLLKQSLQLKNQELERSNEDLLQFAHVASHDLKEPLRKIRTFASRLRDEYGSLLPEKATTYFAKMDSSFNRMFAMVEGVLLYSSVEALEIASETVDLNRIIEDIESDLEVLIQQKGATIVSEQLLPVSGSPVLLRQLLYNLINNALKFTSDGRKPHVSIDGKFLVSGKANGLSALPPNQRWVQVSVTDNGIGFRQQDAEKIFKTFTRLHSKDHYEGTGLGLSLCKKIVERHHGAIYAESEEGKGARFIIVLPAA